MIYDIEPVPAPRMTQRDKWLRPPRPCVMQYWNFRDAIKNTRISIPHNGAHIIFHLPMPDSWSRAKKAKYQQKPHKVRPDVDNLYKALSDSVFKNDSCISDIRISKIWDYKGRIEII